MCPTCLWASTVPPRQKQGRSKQLEPRGTFLTVCTLALTPSRRSGSHCRPLKKHKEDVVAGRQTCHWVKKEHWKKVCFEAKPPVWRPRAKHHPPGHHTFLRRRPSRVPRPGRSSTDPRPRIWFSGAPVHRGIQVPFRRFSTTNVHCAVAWCLDQKSTTTLPYQTTPRYTKKSTVPPLRFRSRPRPLLVRP